MLKNNRLDFFIAGVQKGGTTALHSKLQDHPQIFLPERKEVHFFDNEQIKWGAADPYASYHQYFDFEQDKIFGEATPNYLYWPKSAKRMAAYNPDAKIVVIFRHPTFRALSAWKMEVTRGAETLDFSTAVSVRGRARVWFARGGVHRKYSYVEKGQYVRQIERLLRFFPKEQVLFLTSDALWRDEGQTMARVCRFLSIDPARLPARDQKKKYVVPVDSTDVPLPDKKILAALSHRFHTEIEGTAKITGLDLSHWLDPEYAEPMMSGGKATADGLDPAQSE